MFAKWPDHLPADVRVCVPCLPGRDARVDEMPLAGMVPLVRDLAEKMLPLPDALYALFGHSTGAFVAFELAHELSRLGYPPAHLFVSSQRGPQLPYPGKPTFALPDREFLAAVVERYQNIPRQVLEHAELMAIVLPTLRADFTLTEVYRYRATCPLACPITAFGGMNDRLVIREHLEAWAGETNHRFRLHLLPGGHFFHQEPQARETLLSLMREDSEV